MKIAPAEEEFGSLPPTQEGAPEEPRRKVTVLGNPESQWKAQYLIFEKLREEGFSAGLEDVKLTVEILVPSSQVKIIFLSLNMIFLSLNIIFLSLNIIFLNATGCHGSTELTVTLVMSHMFFQS